MRLNGFDLNQLLCLDALLRERNVSRAAEAVHLSQSAMSWVLARLREHFADPLLVRSGRTLVLTPFAESLVAPVSDLIVQAQSFVARTPDQPAPDAERVLRIIASDYVVTAGLAETIQTATARHPNIKIELLPLTVASAGLITRGDADLLFAGQALDVGMPPSQTVFEDDFVCLVCAENGPRGPKLSPDRYLAARHIVLRYFEHQMTFEDEEGLRRQGVARDRRISVWSHSLIPPLLSGTDMIATTAARSAAEIAARWPVRVLPFPFPHEPIRVYAYWHASRNEDRMLEELLHTFRNSVGGG